MKGFLGLSNVLWIVVAAIVILVVALVLMTVFTGGIQNFLNIFNPWSTETASKSICQGRCQQACFGVAAGGNPNSAFFPGDNVNGKSCNAWGVNCATCGVATGGGVVTYTCTQTSGQSCQQSNCASSQVSGTGSCPPTQVCCKTQTI